MKLLSQLAVSLSVAMLILVSPTPSFAATTAAAAAAQKAAAAAAAQKAAAAAAAQKIAALNSLNKTTTSSTKSASPSATPSSQTTPASLASKSSVDTSATFSKSQNPILTGSPSSGRGNKNIMSASGADSKSLPNSGGPSDLNSGYIAPGPTLSQ